MFGYSVLRSSVHSVLHHKLLSLCQDMDMRLEGLHTETGPGVVEAAILVDDSLHSADKAILFKTFVKVLAQKNKLMANFMAKWSDQYPGQSGHIHCSLLDENDNAVFSKNEKGEMSDLMCNFLGGLQKYMRDFTVLLAPTVNSYKRLCPGAWAPINMTWGRENRTTAFRIIEGSPHSTRIENRLGGADANPYLALAATLGAGLLGLEQNLQPTEEVKGGAYSLKVSSNLQVPSSLKEAYRLFKGSEAARLIFGEKFVDHFSSTREWEYNQYSIQKKPYKRNDRKISQWELERYFEII